MRLRRLDLTRYGKFTDHSVDFGMATPGKPDLHIVYGLNEAGKSTALSAYLDLLFGIEERTRYGFLHQPRTMEVGGSLEFSGRTHQLRRIKQRANSLLDAQGQPVNEALLSVPLAGLSREAYRMMFSLDDQTLEEGGNAILESKGDLGELLFSASAGLAGISGILEGVAKEADGIFRKRASSTRMAELKKAIAELKGQRAEIDVQASTFRQLTGAFAEADAAYQEALRALGAARTRQERTGLLLRAFPLMAEYRRGALAAEGFVDLPHPPADWAAALPGLIDQQIRLATQEEGLAAQVEALCATRDAIALDAAALVLADRVARLAEGEARFRTAREDLPRRRAELADWQRKRDVMLKSLDQSDPADVRALLVPAATIGALRDLIAEKSGIVVGLETAEREYGAARAAEEKEAALAAMPDGGADGEGAALVAELGAILGRLRHGDVGAELRLAQRRVTEGRRRFAEALAPLHPWSAGPEALARLVLPTPQRIEGWKGRLAELDARRAQVAQQRAATTSDIAEGEARLGALRQSATLLDDEEARDALSARDAAWARHKQALEPETAARFEQLMRNSDAIAATRLAGAGDLAELRGLTSDLAMARARLASLDDALAANAAELAQLHHEAMAETPDDIGLSADLAPGALLAALARWREAYGMALGAASALREAEAALAEADRLVSAEQEGLASALSRREPAMARLPLAALIAAAETVLQTAAAAAARRGEADRRRAEIAHALRLRARSREEARLAAKAWDERWAGALGATWFADRHHSVGAVRAVLDVLGALPALLAEGDALRHRIDAMTQDLDDFGAMVAQLHAELGLAAPTGDPLEAARALTRRVEAARRGQQQHEEALAALDRLGEERAALAGAIAELAARSAEMTDFFGLESLAEVREALELCRQRDQVAQQQDQLARQIVEPLQEVSLADAMATLDGIDLPALEQEAAELGARIEDMDGQVRRLFADKDRAASRLDAIGGDDAVARIEGRRRTLLLEMEDQALRYLRLRSGTLIAEQALYAYRERHRSAMMNRASEAFRAMTRGAYSGLATRPEKDREALIGLVEGGGSKLAVDMSKGTRFQLYLALRLAGYEEFARARPPVPFIADDIMETFDEPRSEEVFRLLGHMAGLGQVIYLTHHRHLCDIARAVVPGVRIHEIDRAG